jgi:hypothetical protein
MKKTVCQPIVPKRAKQRTNSVFIIGDKDYQMQSCIMIEVCYPANSGSNIEVEKKQGCF